MCVHVVILCLYGVRVDSIWNKTSRLIDQYSQTFEVLIQVEYDKKMLEILQFFFCLLFDFVGCL